MGTTSRCFLPANFAISNTCICLQHGSRSCTALRNGFHACLHRHQASNTIASHSLSMFHLSKMTSHQEMSATQQESAQKIPAILFALRRRLLMTTLFSQEVLSSICLRMSSSFLSCKTPRVWHGQADRSHACLALFPDFLAMEPEHG